MKSIGKTFTTVLGWAVLPLFLTLVGQASAQNTTFTNRVAFEAAAGSSPVLLENFDVFTNGQQVTQLFGGVITFASPFPTIFFGSWNHFGTGGQFSGGAIIPEPRFQGSALILNFSSPVFGVGGNAFDDFDGTPFVNVITLTMTTSLGTTFSISETFPNVGDSGFLGATSSEGIMQAIFSIDNSNGNLEVDLLAVVAMPPVIAVDIDIKPGSYPNCFNLNGHGVIPVAILGSEDLDVNDIKVVDFETPTFNGLKVRVRGNKGPLCSIEDSNGDSYFDLVCHFEDDPDQWAEGTDENATLIGELLDGTPIEGTDSICIVP